MAKKSRTREARQRRQKQQRQNQRNLILVGIVIVAILAIALIVVSNQPVEAFVPAGVEARYEGLERSLSLEGYPRLGDPEAPVTVEEYSSFSCPGCEAFHDTSFEAILDRVKTGQVLFTYIPLQTGSIPNAPGSARAALCAGQQGLFWEMHDVLFEWHTLYGNTAFSQGRLLAGIDALGLNGNSFTGCFNSQAITNVLDAAQAEGVASTPTIDVNGVTVTTGEGGGIPSTQEILTAIDNATPNNWTPGAGEDEPTELDGDSTIEMTEEPDSDIDSDEVTEEPDSDAEMNEDQETTNDTDSESEADEDNTSGDELDEAESEATEEAD